MALPVDLITADPDINSPSTIEAELDLYVTQVKAMIPQLNAALTALNLNDLSDTSTSSISIDLTPGKTATVTASKGFVAGGYLIFADAAAPTTNSMVVQIVSYSGTTLTFDPVTTNGSGTKTSWAISFHARPEPAVGDHEIYMTTPIGFGSTDLNIRGYSVTQRSVGTAITHAYTAANGSIFTIVDNGKYTVELVDAASGSNQNIGVSVNSTELTTNIKIITAADRFALLNNISTTETSYLAANNINLTAGDKVRVHTNRLSNTADVTGWVRIVKTQSL